MTKKIHFEGNKILHHLDRVLDWKKGKLIYPIYMSFGPTKRCNHQCLFCAYTRQNKKTADFKLIEYKKILNLLSKKGLKSIFFSGDGEPLLNKDCIEMIEYTKKVNVDVALNTNGSMISESNANALVRNLSWIRISFNGGSKESYAKVHNCSESEFEKVLKNIALLVEAKERVKSHVKITVQLVLLPENIGEIEKLAQIVKAIGVDYFAVKPFLQHPQAKYKNDFTPSTNQIEAIKDVKKLSDSHFSFIYRESNEHKYNQRGYKNCYSFHFMAELDADGNLYSCGPQLGNEKFCFGNVIEKGFEYVWSKKEKVIEQIYENHNVDNCMSCCRNDSVNETLWSMMNPPDHINYI